MAEIHVSVDVDVKALRARLGKMTEAELLRFGKGNRYMCGRDANLGRPPLAAYVIQLREARAEWRRRHPKIEQRAANAYTNWRNGHRMG